LEGTEVATIKNRKKTRELLMRLLFQMTSTGDFSDEAKDGFLADTSHLFDKGSCAAIDMPYFNWAFQCVRDHLDEIDSDLTKVSEGWAVQRMGTVELAILRVAAAELLYIDDIDAGVSINEAVVLAKKYGTEKSASFVNGILGAIARQGERAQV